MTLVGLAAREKGKWWFSSVLGSKIAGFVSVIAMLELVFIISLWFFKTKESTNYRSRNFFGTLQVIEQHSPAYGPYRYLLHGRISHGSQYPSPEYSRLRNTYYGESSGIGLAVLQYPSRQSDPEYKLSMGVIGLGTGTMSVYAGKGDRLRFYEINPDVLQVARSHFLYLSECEAKITTVLGDARLQLERELDQGRANSFDILVVDAFSSNAIRMHLLTKESLDLYRKHIRKDGILAIHISNRFVDLKPVVHGYAVHAGFDHPLLFAYNPAPSDETEISSEWILLTENEAFLKDKVVVERSTAWPSGLIDTLWTDDFGSLWQVMK